MAIERRAAPKRPYLKLAQRLLAVPDARIDGGLRGALPSAGDIAALADDLMTVLFPSSGRSFTLRGQGPDRPAGLAGRQPGGAGAAAGRGGVPGPAPPLPRARRAT